MNKKNFLLSFLMMSLFYVSHAQVNERSIGARFGWGGDISYHHPLSSTTRAEIDLGLSGFKNGGFVLTGIHQWLFAPNGGFNLFAGVGPQVGSFYYDESDRKGYGLGLAVSGQVGVEYNIDEVPLQVSLDWRPSINVIAKTNNFAYQGFSLGIRYRF